MWRRDPPSLFWFRQRHIQGHNLNTRERIMKNIRVWRNFCYLQEGAFRFEYKWKCSIFALSWCASCRAIWNLDSPTARGCTLKSLNKINIVLCMRKRTQKHLAHTCPAVYSVPTKWFYAGEFHITQTPWVIDTRGWIKYPGSQQPYIRPPLLSCSCGACSGICVLELRKEFPPTHLKTNKLFRGCTQNKGWVFLF